MRRRRPADSESPATSSWSSRPSSRPSSRSPRYLPACPSPALPPPPSVQRHRSCVHVLPARLLRLRLPCLPIDPTAGTRTRRVVPAEGCWLVGGRWTTGMIQRVQLRTSSSKREEGGQDQRPSRDASTGRGMCTRTLTTLELALLRSYHSSPPLTSGSCDTRAMNLGSPSATSSCPCPTSYPNEPTTDAPLPPSSRTDAGPTGLDVPELELSPESYHAAELVDAMDAEREVGYST
jgi:hypothetical protein